MEMTVHSVSESSASHVPPAIADSQPDKWIWVVCGALFCLLLIARLTGGVPAASAAGALPPGAVAVPAAILPAPAASVHHKVSRI